MGLLAAAGVSLGASLGDQWKDYFYCPAMEKGVLVRKVEHAKGRGGLFNRGGNANVITDGSKIAVNEGQCMVIVNQGKITDVCAEPGAYTYKDTDEVSILGGDLSEGLGKSIQNFKQQLVFGGVKPKDQRVYFFNVKNIMGNKYGTPNPVPFMVNDPNVGLHLEIGLRCFGEYVLRLVDPVKFYQNVCGNVEDEYKIDQIADQLRSEFLTALGPALAKISAEGVRYSEIPGKTIELAKALNEVLSASWGEIYGLNIVSVGVSSIRTSEEEEKIIRDAQRSAVYSNPALAAGALVGAQAQAMQDAAKNSAGAMTGFAGVNMASQAGGVNASQLFAMGAQQQAQAAAQPRKMQAGGWTCAKCGAQGNTGKFCSECGAPRPAEKKAWTCPKCGAQGNTGKFCSECGAPRPAEAWTCPKCGAQGNTGKFCAECGAPRP